MRLAHFPRLARALPSAPLGRLSAIMALVLLLGMLPTLGMLWLVAQAGLEDAKREAGFRLTQAAQMAAALQGDAVASLRHALALLGSQPLDWAEDPQSCAARAREMAQQNPFLSSLAVIRLDGTVICTTHGQGQGTNLGDRPYVEAVLQGGGFSLGAPVVARTNGQVVLPMAFRATAPAQGLNPPAVLGATLDLERIGRCFSTILTEQARAADGRMKVYDAAGRMLATYPPRPGAPQELPLDSYLVAAKHGSFDLVGADGRERLVGYAHAAEGGTIYTATLVTAALMAPAQARLRAVLLLGLLAGSFGLAVSLYIARVRILRPLAILTEFAAQAGTGARCTAARLPGEFDTLRSAMASMIEDVASRERRLNEANIELQRLAERDALTGIANRRSFNSALAEAWARGMMDQEHVALVILDVDFFKKFNDRYGHLPGDACLCKVAAAIDGVRLRERDMVARLGGEEFVMLLPRTDTEGALVVAERALDAIRNRMILHEDGVDGTVTASAGVAACVPIRGMDPLALLAAADAALYAAKARGRDNAATASSLSDPVQA